MDDPNAARRGLIFGAAAADNAPVAEAPARGT